MTNKKIPATVRQDVWDNYIGEDIGKIKCPLCQRTEIRPLQFHCAHVIARSKGGSDDLSNLRPICSSCNSSMYNHGMIEFARTYYPNAPIHETFKQMPTNPIINQIELENNSDQIIKAPTKHIIIEIQSNSSDAQVKKIVKKPTTKPIIEKIQPESNSVHVHVHVHEPFNQATAKPIIKQIESGNNNGSSERKLVEKKNKIDNFCQYCGQCFTRRDNLLRHLKGKRCRLLKIKPTDLPLLTQMMQGQNKSEENLEVSALKSQIKELEEQFKKQTKQT